MFGFWQKLLWLSEASVFGRSFVLGRIFGYFDNRRFGIGRRSKFPFWFNTELFKWYPTFLYYPMFSNSSAEDDCSRPLSEDEDVLSKITLPSASELSTWKVDSVELFCPFFGYWTELSSNFSYFYLQRSHAGQWMIIGSLLLGRLGE